MDEENYCYCHKDHTDEEHDCLDYMECEECPYYYEDLDQAVEQMKYKCVVELLLDDYDEDGFATGGWSTIPFGSIWEVDNDSPKIIGNDDNIRLISENKWIKILGSTLLAHFKEIKAVK